MSNARDIIQPLLRKVEPRPVLIDVGASPELPAVWASLAQQAKYVGFDPAGREVRQSNCCDTGPRTQGKEDIPAAGVEVGYPPGGPHRFKTLKPNSQVL